MIKVIYSPKGEVVPDHYTEQWADDILLKARHRMEEYKKKALDGTLTENDDHDLVVLVGCEIMVLQLVYKMWASHVHHEHINFYIDESEEPLKKIQRNGRWLVQQTKGWCETYDTLLNKLIGAY